MMAKFSQQMAKLSKKKRETNRWLHWYASRLVNLFFLLGLLKVNLYLQVLKKRNDKEIRSINPNLQTTSSSPSRNLGAKPNVISSNALFQATTLNCRFYKAMVSHNRRWILPNVFAGHLMLVFLYNCFFHCYVLRHISEMKQEYCVTIAFTLLDTWC
jgi:hypothetical protein